MSEEMRGSISLAWWSLIVVIISRPTNSADVVRPMRVEEVQASETWAGVREGGPHWVIRHADGIKVVHLATGESKHVAVKPTDKHAWIGNQGHWISGDGNVVAVRVDPEKVVLVHLGSAAGGERPSRTASAEDLFGTKRWPALTYLSRDGHSCVTMHRRDKVFHLARVHFEALEPRVVFSRQIGQDAQDLFVCDGAIEWLITVTSAPRKPRTLQLFAPDGELVQESKIDDSWLVAGSCGVRSAINHPYDSSPIAILASSQHNHWRMITRNPEQFAVASKGTHLGQFRGILAAAISPDMKWIVTSVESLKPTLSIWSAADGQFKRAVVLEGGVRGQFPSDGTIIRLRFSSCGQYLSASDRRNAYLLQVDSILEESD